MDYPVCLICKKECNEQCVNVKFYGLLCKTNNEATWFCHNHLADFRDTRDILYKIDDPSKYSMMSIEYGKAQTRERKCTDSGCDNFAISAEDYCGHCQFRCRIYECKRRVSIHDELCWKCKPKYCRERNCQNPRYSTEFNQWKVCEYHHKNTYSCGISRCDNLVPHKDDLCPICDRKYCRVKKCENKRYNATGPTCPSLYSNDLCRYHFKLAYSVEDSDSDSSWDSSSGDLAEDDEISSENPEPASSTDEKNTEIFPEKEKNFFNMSSQQQSTSQTDWLIFTCSKCLCLTWRLGIRPNYCVNCGDKNIIQVNVPDRLVKDMPHTGSPIPEQSPVVSPPLAETTCDSSGITRPKCMKCGTQCKTKDIIPYFRGGEPKPFILFTWDCPNDSCRVREWKEVVEIH